VMSVFRKSNLGGLGIESEFDRLENDSEAQTVAAVDLNESLELFAYQTALAAELLKDHRPDKDAAEWQKRCNLMRQTALELARAVKAKDGKAAFAAVARGNANCTACHKTFR
jgi:cytochrome c'